MTIKPSSYPTTRPTLNLDFAKTKRLDPRITFSRSSSGTYVDANGVIQSAATNVARFDHNPTTGESLGLLVEEARTNLFTNSEQLQTWASLMNDILVPNQILGPSGLINAVKHTPSTTSWGHIIYQNIAFSAVPYTLSVYAKPAGYNFLHISGSAWGGWASYINFDLSNGTVTAGTGYSSYSVTALPNGWYRCSVTFTPAAGTNWIGFGAANLGTNLPGGFAGNGTSGIYVWGAQLEAGAFPTSYIPTPATFTSRASTATYYDANGVIQTAASNVARSAAFFPDSSGVMRSAGLLLEAAGTNAVTYSEQFDNAAWTKVNTTVTANSVVAPDGNMTADTITGNGSSGTHWLYNNDTSAGPKTVSVYAKAGTNNFIQLMFAVDASVFANFNLSNGTVGSTGTASTASIQALPNGWYRCSLYTNSTTATISHITLITSGTSARAESNSLSTTVYLWGAQSETSATFPTSYIPTVATTVTRAADVSSSATVTRSADVASITGTNFSSWYNQSEGTVVTDAIGGKKSGRVFEINDNTDNNRHLAAWSDSGINFASTVAGNTFFNSVAPTSANRRTSALAYKSALYGGVVNSGAAVTSSNTTVPVVNRMYIAGPIGDGTNLNYYFNGTVSRLTYWPTRLSDATLQAITR